MIIRNILILTVIAALVPTAMSSVSASASTEIALFSSDSDSLSISGNGDNAIMELKATNENGKTNKVSDFQLTADNVLYIKVGDRVTVKDNAEFTKVITTDGNNNQKVIGITSNGVIDSSKLVDLTPDSFVILFDIVHQSSVVDISVKISADIRAREYARGIHHSLSHHQMNGCGCCHLAYRLLF
jgi:hypothetical protein